MRGTFDVRLIATRSYNHPKHSGSRQNTTPHNPRARATHLTMASQAAVPFLVAMMLLTGVCNTLLGKYQVRKILPQTSLPSPQNQVFRSDACE